MRVNRCSYWQQEMKKEKREQVMMKVGIMGATGYAGGELARLLLQRADVEITWYGSRSHVKERYASLFKNMVRFVDAACLDDNMEAMAEEVDVIFTATPQGYCASLMSPQVLLGAKVIDLSADFRLRDVGVYEQWYKIVHKTPVFLKEAAYGLPEINREAIKKARLVANPGCYPTCSILAIYPLIKEGLLDPRSLIIDAKSGTSGAGRGAKVDSLFCEVNENMKAYGVGVHRHTPEIEEQLSLAAAKPVIVSFTPHLAPMNRGILVTAYGSLLKTVTYEEVKAIYEEYYGGEYFVRVLNKGETPETKWVEGSNFVDINVFIDARTNRAVMMGAMDNLIKGAAGQAVQNMNILFGLPENTGLKQVPMFP